MKNISLFGFPAVWKWTQANKILDNYKDFYCYFEAGNILRSLSQNNNVLGQYIKKRIDQWYMVDDAFIISLFDAYLVILEKWQNLLLDAFPRKLWQMYLFLDRMERLNLDFVWIYLDLSEENILERLVSRRICKNCWSCYNLVLNPSLDKCSNCWGGLIKREDDREDVIKKRIKVYKKETIPVIDFLYDKGLLKKVDATLPPEKLFEEISEIIKS